MKILDKLLHEIKQYAFLYWKQYQQNKRIHKIDIVLFFQQFSLLLTSGIPLIYCLDILEKTQSKYALQRIIFFIKKELLSGKSLFDGFLLYQRYFDRLTCHLIRIGEHIGNLEMMLTMIASHQEKQLQFQQEIKQILFYPCLIIASAFSMTISMFLFVIPKFAELFQESLQRLPFITKAIFFIAGILQAYIGLFVCIFVSIFLCLLYNKTRQKMLAFIMRYLIHMPIVANLLRNLFLAKWIRQLSIMLHAGMSLTNALALMETNSHTFQNFNMEELKRQVSSGKQLHEAMTVMQVFPDFIIQMLKVGEESGQLEPMLNKIAELMERDIYQYLKKFNQLLEPLIMIILGVLIGALVIGMYLPIFKLGTAV